MTHNALMNGTKFWSRGTVRQSTVCCIGGLVGGMEKTERSFTLSCHVLVETHALKKIVLGSHTQAEKIEVSL